MLEKHDLVHELPEFRDQIHHLKMNDAHFSRLFEAYHELDHRIHQHESGLDNTSDEHLEELKKERLSLKDQLFAMLKDCDLEKID